MATATATQKPAEWSVTKVIEMEALAKLSTDLKEAAARLPCDEARYLVDLYYAIQHFRIQSAGMIRAADAQEVNEVLQWAFDNTRKLEHNIKRALDIFSDQYRVGLWMKSICGIGPVIAAGFLSHLDIRDPDNPQGRETVGHFWRFAGLDPSVTWEKKTKRPWNAKLKTLCWKLGESFIKNKFRDQDYYGKLYENRKQLELERNESGANKELAAQHVAEKRYTKTTEAWKYISDGVLPPAQLHARARRYMVKIFLSHLHHVMYEDYYGKKPPVPFAFTEKCEGDHRHFIAIPNYPYEEGGKSLRELFGE